MLTPEQIEYYRTNGFVTVENVLTPAQVEEARRVVDEFIEKSRTVTASDEIYDLDPAHTPEQPMVRRLKNPVNIHPFFNDLLHADVILDAVADVIGPGIRFHGSKLNTKTSKAGSAVEWHQDFAFYPHTNDDVTAVGIYLDDTDLDNGCMLVIPGSQKGPILDHHQDGVFIGAISPSRCEADLKQAVPVQVKAGGISLHHGHMLHGSAPSRSGRPRRLLLFELTAVDAWPLLGVPDLDEYNKKILRGEPTLNVRLTPVSARIPRPLPAKAGSIFEIQGQAKESIFAGR